MVADDDGKERYPADGTGNPRRSLGADSPYHSASGPAQVHGAQAGPPQGNLGRHHIPDARRLSLEPPAPGQGDDSTIHRTFPRWVELGVLERIWAVLVGELGSVEWEWQAAGCAMGKARFEGIRLAATPQAGARQTANEAFWPTPAEAR